MTTAELTIQVNLLLERVSVQGKAYDGLGDETENCSTSSTRFGGLVKQTSPGSSERMLYLSSGLMTRGRPGSAGSIGSGRS